MAQDNSHLHECLRILLKPVVRFCLRWSIGIQDWMEASKAVFIEVAQEEMESKGAKVNVSRLSVSTGIRRREVIRIFKMGESREPNFSYASRIIGQWQSDSDFTTSRGKPRVLSYEGDESEFRELVETISTDVHPGTVLFELERIGAVERSARGLKLVLTQYSAEHDLREGYSMLAADVEDLVHSAEQNLSRNTRPNLHHTTEYDNIPLDELPKISAWVLSEGEKFHEKARKYISKFDQDINPSKTDNADGGRIAVTSFSRVEPPIMRRKRS